MKIGFIGRMKILREFYDPQKMLHSIQNSRQADFE